jgi:hypothetical protein
MISDGTIHYNVWVPDDVIFLLKSLGFNICYSIEKVPDRKDSFLVIAEKS